MKQDSIKQHVQLPNKMGENDLAPKDQLIYLSIRRFMNGQTKVAYPSLAKISEVSGASINTIRNSIKVLEEKDYFKVIKEGRSQKYLFNELKKFEPFSYNFLDKPDLTFTEKSYIVASQQYMYTDVEGIGKISYSNKELSEKINMPESTISKTNRSLVRKKYLTLIKNKTRDIETGCKTDTKLFKLNELGQAVIWVLKNHEDRIQQLEENSISKEEFEQVKQEVNYLKEQLEQSQKLNVTLLKERETLQTNYTL